VPGTTPASQSLFFTASTANKDSHHLVASSYVLIQTSRDDEADKLQTKQLHRITKLTRMTIELSRRTFLSLANTIIRERTEYIDIFLFPPITQSCSVSCVLFTGGRGVSDFSAL